MDAFAVSISSGIIAKKISIADMLKMGGCFGFAQFVMPIIGYFLATGFLGYIKDYDHWLAFMLLSIIGGKMVFDSIKGGGEEGDISDIPMSKLVILAVATSIDALAVGISLAFLEVNVFVASAVIGLTTLVLCMAGVAFGKKIGGVFKKRAELAGGLVLIALGIKILLEHLFWPA